jgi:hypothetical protein
MHSSDCQAGSLFSYVDLEARVRRYHSLRVINAAFKELDGGLEALILDVLANRRHCRSGC